MANGNWGYRKRDRVTPLENGVVTDEGAGV